MLFDFFPESETRQDPVGLLGTKAFLCPPFSVLFVGNRRHSASMTSPESQGAGLHGCHLGKGGDVETKEEQASQRGNGELAGANGHM